MEASALPRRRASMLPRSRRLLGTFSDERLVDEIRRGNEVAFEVVYDRHHRAILSFCRHMLGSQEEAEDAVQQTFASAFAALSGDDRDIRLKAWLYTIARNRSLSILRARREQPAEIEEQPTAGLADEVQQRAELQELLGDLRRLPPEQRDALVLFELGDLSHAEIGGVIGVEPVKVKALVFQARSALIENREARAIPCAEIREQLATASGGGLRRGPLRKHLKTCPGCAAYRDQVRSQRRALAALLPVIPTASLKSAVLGTLGIGGGAGGAGLSGTAGGVAGGGAAAGGAAVAGGGGGVFASIASMGGTKLALGAALATGTFAGGGVAVDKLVHGHGKDIAPHVVESAAQEPYGSQNAAVAQGTPIANGSGGGDPGAGTPIAATTGGERKSGRNRLSADERRAERRRKARERKRGRSRSDGRRGSQELPADHEDGDDDDRKDDDENRGHGNGGSDDDDGDREPRGGGRSDDSDDDGKKGGKGDDDGDEIAAEPAPEPQPAPVTPPAAEDKGGKKGSRADDDEEEDDDSADRPVAAG